MQDVTFEWSQDNEVIRYRAVRLMGIWVLRRRRNLPRTRFFKNIETLGTWTYMDAREYFSRVAKGEEM